MGLKFFFLIVVQFLLKVLKLTFFSILQLNNSVQLQLKNKFSLRKDD